MLRLLSLLLFFVLPPAWALENVSIQLNWKHQFQFAGYYAAIEKGYFKAAGFNVSLRELVEGKDPVAEVLSGHADYGVAASELALHRAKGDPVVALAVIVQHSPLVLLANRRKIPSIDALSQQRIMLLPHEAELFAYLRHEGVTGYRTVPHSFNLRDLIDGRVEAVSAYSTDEPFLLRQQDFPYLAFTPLAAGISFYGDTFFSSEERIRKSGHAVRALREAVLKGWQYAMANPEEMADLIVQRYSTRHSKEHLLFEAAELRRLMQPELIEIGLMSATRWQHIGQTYAELGMLPAQFSLKGLIYESESRLLPNWVLSVFLAAGAILALIGMLAIYFARLSRRLKNEINIRQSVESALQESEIRYRRLTEQSKDVIWNFGLEKMRFTYMSPAVERVRGYSAEEVMQQSLADCLLPESHDQAMGILQDHLQRLVAGDTSAMSAIFEVDQPHKNGGVTAAEVVATFLLDEAGKPIAIHGVSRDISERRIADGQLRAVNDKLRKQLEEIEQLQSALQEQAIRDSLTGCFNRRYLDETLERELWRARREGYPLSLVILDLDHFKQINDTYGHQAGDEALKELARVLQADTRQDDVFCRYGGEEFVVLMPHMPLSVAAERAEMWRTKIAGIKVKFGNFELTFTASLGLAAYPEHGKVADELTQSADLALYIAKHEGRNQLQVYAPPR